MSIGSELLRASDGSRPRINGSALTTRTNGMTSTTPANQKDLLKFFDRYLKGIDNGWESTPRVRVSVLDPGGTDEVNVPYTGWPLKETKYQKFYLDAAYARPLRQAG